jgi:hypothetical protein
MKKAIKQAKKNNNPSTNKKDTRPFTAKKSGYKEDVYNSEEQKSYQKSDIAKDNKRNTAGPKS